MKKMQNDPLTIKHKRVGSSPVKRLTDVERIPKSILR